MNKALKKDLISKVASLIYDAYVFPDVAAKLSETLLDNYKKQSYSEINSPQDLANALNEDMNHLASDKHLALWTDPQLIEDLKSEPLDGGDTHNLEMMRAHNFGFKESKILKGNIGYLNLDGFVDTEVFPEAVTIAEQTMTLFSNARAIIFDLRENGGGHPNMIQLLSSYFFQEEPIHLNSFYWRKTDSETETWTLPNITGERHPHMPLFILTSKATFSASEEFCYNLKHLKRATLIGEVTGGGAHPGEFHLVNDALAIFIPSGRAINPITKTNWEGVGVKPDIEVPADEALDVAIRLALAPTVKQ